MHKARVSHVQQLDKNPACCFTISDQCGNRSVACSAAVTSPLCSSPAFPGFPHYTTWLAIFPELKLLSFFACFCDYTMIIYDVIKSSAHLALRAFWSNAAAFCTPTWCLLVSNKATGGQTLSWAAEPEGFPHQDLTFLASQKICLFSYRISKVLLGQQKQNSHASAYFLHFHYN